MSRKLLSVVVPCYNEENVLMQFYDDCINALDGLSEELDHEFIFVDDGSTDGTLDIMRELSAMDTTVKYISFSRNFGKEAGIYAGLTEAKGDFVVLLDADLQHPPKYIKNMYQYVADGEYDSVAMKRTDRRGEGRIRSFFSKKFYRLMQKLSNTDIPQGATDFRIMTRQFVDSVLSMSEYNRFTKGIFGWVGFRTMWMSYPNTERAGGESKWSFMSLVRYSLDGIVAFSTKPLILSAVLGTIICLISFIMIVFTVVKTIIWGDPVAGYPTLITVILLMSGLQLLFLGIIGQYFAKAYMEVKKRPVYIAKEKHV
ncbi:MAG: glycosyltransferase family 2 protein [Clostridiales bacterium]|nr:glycosyltransferase family 2 protein [Clostridiales bacterium]